MVSDIQPPVITNKPPAPCRRLSKLRRAELLRARWDAAAAAIRVNWITRDPVDESVARAALARYALDLEAAEHG